MASIEDQLSPEELAVVRKLAKRGTVEIPNPETIIDYKPSPYQLTEDVDEETGEIVQKVGGIEKFRHKVSKPDYDLKGLHPDRFTDEVDQAKKEAANARVTYNMLKERVDAANAVASPDHLRDMVLKGSEARGEPRGEPADVLDKVAEQYICNHPGCGKAFPTTKQLLGHKRALAHGEYAEDGPKWEQSLVYARLKKKETEASDEGTGTEPDQESEG